MNSLNEVEPGDFIYARAIPEAGGDFTALKVWGNIANFYGTVEEIKNDDLILRIGDSRSKARLTVHTNADTIINESSGISHHTLRVNQFVQALGVYQKDGSLLATRLWISF